MMNDVVDVFVVLQMENIYWAASPDAVFQGGKDGSMSIVELKLNLKGRNTDVCGESWSPILPFFLSCFFLPPHIFISHFFISSYLQLSNRLLPQTDHSQQVPSTPDPLV